MKSGLFLRAGKGDKPFELQEERVIQEIPMIRRDRDEKKITSLPRSG